MDHEELRQRITEHNADALFADGYEDAIVGIAERCGQATLVVYDAEKCIQVLIDRDSMAPDEAREFFEFNTLGAWIGPNTPLFLWRVEDMA